MGVFDHWHPVFPESKLKSKPVKVTLGGRDIALFRTASGEIGAVDDCCVHRRASLSRGTVVGDRLQCGYHGWTYDINGQAESPGTPKLRACARHYEIAVLERFIWIKSAGSVASIPAFETDGYEFVCAKAYPIKAPLEVVLDNFTEVEHTPTTHANFGYDLQRMSEVKTSVEGTTDTVRVVNVGPQKKTPWVIQQLAGLKSGDTFTDDWTTYYSPVYSVYEQFWNDPKNGKERRDRYRIWVFFNPLNDTETELVIFTYLRARSAARRAFIQLTRSLLAKIVEIEIVCDVRMIESLADKSPQIEGMKLSRFDRVLGMNRERINRIYRGQSIESPEEARV